MMLIACFAAEAYTAQTAETRKAAPSAAYLSRTYLLIPALRLLKLHVHQLALARAPLADFGKLLLRIRLAESSCCGCCCCKLANGARDICGCDCC